MFFTLIRFYSPMIAKLYLLPATSQRIRFGWPHISDSDALFSVGRNWLRCLCTPSIIVDCCDIDWPDLLLLWYVLFRGAASVCGVSRSVRFLLSPGLICAKSTILISIRSTILAFWDFSFRAKPYWTNYFTLWPTYYSVVHHPKRSQKEKAHRAVYRESFLRSRT